MWLHTNNSKWYNGLERSSTFGKHYLSEYHTRSIRETWTHMVFHLLARWRESSRIVSWSRLTQLATRLDMLRNLTFSSVDRRCRRCNIVRMPAATENCQYFNREIWDAWLFSEVVDTLPTSNIVRIPAATLGLLHLHSWEGHLWRLRKSGRVLGSGKLPNEELRTVQWLRSIGEKQDDKLTLLAFHSMIS
jgi:hypothetical protein